MSEAEVFHRSREVAEHFALTLHLPTNTRFEAKAVADFRQGVGEKTGFHIMTSFDMKAESWIICKCVISGEMGDSPMTTTGMREQGWRADAAHTAYTDQVLAFHRKYVVKSDPAISKAVLIAYFTPYVRFASHIPPDQWSRVRRIRYVLANGAPDDNMPMLPALQMKMRALGHTPE